MSNPYFDVTVDNDPAHVTVTPKSYGPQVMLATEVERLILELRNAVNVARRRNAPRHKFTDLS